MDFISEGALDDYSMEEIIDAIGNLSVTELSELIEEFKSRFKVEIAQITAPAPVIPEAPKPVEKDEFDVVLVSAGEKKLAVLKEVRTLTGLSLKDAKDLVDGAPKTLKEGLSKVDAENMKRILEAQGGVVDLR